jgi:hypothetical protein
MMGGDQNAVKMVERARQRVSGGQPAPEEGPPLKQMHLPNARPLDGVPKAR